MDNQPTLGNAPKGGRRPGEGEKYVFPRSLLTVLVAVCLAASAIVLGTGTVVGQSGAAGSRVCPISTSSTRFECLSEIRTTQNGHPQVNAEAVYGYGPDQFHSAYNLPTTAPTNQTIAIVDAYSNPNVFADLQTYDRQFGLPAFPLCSTSQQSACIAILNQWGASSPLPAADYGWATEISLDVQVAHAICQNCRINLYEADSSYTFDLDTAVNTAVSMGATVVSNSYGSFLNECSDSAYNHPNVAIVVSSGDDGYGVACPASMGSVVSVGGTSLYLNGSGGYGSEHVWWDGDYGTGSGCSNVNTAPSWQTSASNWSSIGCGDGRGMNDVSADADPNTGAAEYDSYNYGGWVVMGGTSLSAPLIAGVYGLAASASSWSYPAQSVYQSPDSLHDVTSGSNGYCDYNLECNAGSGYDLPTGVGTPNGLGGFSAASSSGPANDNLAAAQILTGPSGTASGSNVDATRETGESVNTPESVPVSSVWYAWQAPSAGMTVVDTCGSGFDTTLGVYTGSAVSALTTVAANDDDPLALCGHKSRVTFDAAAGQTYYFSVDGYGSKEGAITLNWNFSESDTTPPGISGPTGVIVAPQSLGSTAKVQVSWVATDSSGVVSDELQMKKGTGAWTQIYLASPTATSADITLTVGKSYRFRVRATDSSGNISAWASTSSAALHLVQENAKSISYSGTWKRASLSGASGGYVKYATASTARAKLTFTGAAASFVTTVSSGRGICEIWIDGSLATTIDTYSTSTAKKRIAFATPRLNYGSHTIEIRVKGSKRSASTSARVDVDAFLTWP